MTIKKLCYISPNTPNPPSLSYGETSKNSIMLYFTKYAETKFDILNKHKVYFTREDVENTVKAPDKIRKKGKNNIYTRDGMAVILKNDEGVAKIITFYPIK